MPLYISEPTLKRAVNRLGVSNSGANLGDYLVFKRALNLSRDVAADEGREMPVTVITGTRSTPFMQAHVEIGLRVSPRIVFDAMGYGTLIECMQSLITDKKKFKAKKRDSSLTVPYFVPFGAKRDSSLGYRQAKWPSNGPSDTVSRWQARSKKPLILVPDSSPKEYSFAPQTEKELSEFFSIGSASAHFSGEKPRLLDAAVWWFRFTELEEILDEKADEASMEDELVRTFITNLGLSDIEIAALFQRESDAESDQSRIAEEAAPYLVEGEVDRIEEA